MPRFYFRLTDGHRSTEDRDGLDLVDQHSARREATQIVRDLLQGAMVFVGSPRGAMPAE